LYGITGITILPYNSKANAQIERPHKDLRSSLAKATNGQLSKWFWYLPHVLWADHITARKRFGMSSFFLATGAHPTIPLDILEATWLVNLPNRILTRGELIGFRARALAKHRADVLHMQERVHEEKVKRTLEYE
jgi:transposase InsO family protein